MHYEAPHSAASYNFLPLRSKYSLSTLFSNTLNLCSSLSVRDQVSHLYKTRGKTIVFLYGKLGRMKINLLWISEEGEG
jgi:hypothetical protein